MKEAYAEYEKDKKREDFEEYYKKKIVRCEFCGKQSRYGNGKCPHCGGSLPKIHAKENEN